MGRGHLVKVWVLRRVRPPWRTDSGAEVFGSATKGPFDYAVGMSAGGALQYASNALLAREFADPAAARLFRTAVGADRTWKVCWRRGIQP